MTITVNAVNDAPVANDDNPGAATTDEDTPFIVNAPLGVIPNDTDEKVTLSATIVNTDNANGTVTLDPDGGFSYAPNADFFGTATFTCKVTDNGTPVAAESNVATVTINVTSVNDGLWGLLILTTTKIRSL